MEFEKQLIRKNVLNSSEDELTKLKESIIERIEQLIEPALKNLRMGVKDSSKIE